MMHHSGPSKKQIVAFKFLLICSFISHHFRFFINKIKMHSGRMYPRNECIHSGTNIFFRGTPSKKKFEIKFQKWVFMILSALFKIMGKI